MRTADLTKEQMCGAQNPPIENDVSLNDHIEHVGHNFTVGVVLVFTVEREHKDPDSIEKIDGDASTFRNRVYLRICSSNWMVLCVSFSRGTVKRSPAQSCMDKHHCSYLDRTQTCDFTLTPWLQPIEEQEKRKGDVAALMWQKTWWKRAQTGNPFLLLCSRQADNYGGVYHGDFWKLSK